MNENQLREMVDAFLAWPLPDDVCADAVACRAGASYRTGTNLLTAAQARAMFEHCLAVVRAHDRDARSCTCHPDDNPPRPCPRKYALHDCRQAAMSIQRYDLSGEYDFEMAPTDSGDYVLYADHAAELAALRAELQKVRSAAISGMDAATQHGHSLVQQAARLKAESNPDALESERAANALLTEQLQKAEAERDALRAHVEQCPKHPMSALHTRIENALKLLSETPHHDECEAYQYSEGDDFEVIEESACTCPIAELRAALAGVGR